MPDDAASLSFLPWVRQGAAGAISVTDFLGLPPPPEAIPPGQPAVAAVAITLAVNDSPVPTTAVRLRGPADVVGIDAHQVLRTDPRPNTSDFEPNCFPAIEFDRADFPWLFTPAKANPNAQLRPWLCLVVVRVQQGVELASTPDTPLPTLHIAGRAKPFIELPDLKESWAWAHAQVAADNPTDSVAVANALDTAPQLSLSRLVCPRLLAPNTEYLACVVPTFEVGCRAGLGDAVPDTELTAVDALKPAWTVDAIAMTPIEVTLPVYYSWQFRTGPGGDFESLARALRIPEVEEVKGLGRRPVSIGEPPFENVAASAFVMVEGALLPFTGPTSPVVWSDPVVAAAFEEVLADIVNQPGLNQILAPTEDPLLAPPLYGRWHAQRATVTPGEANWLDALNLDPRWRSAAALGTQVIQQHQEALMASAWQQAAAIQAVNQWRRQLQLSMAVGESLHTRHLSRFDQDEMTLRFAAPAFDRIRVPPTELNPLGRTLRVKMMASVLPVAATGVAMRRIGRLRGPLTRRLAAQGVPRTADRSWVARLNLRAVDEGAPTLPPRLEIQQAAAPPRPAVQELVSTRWRSGFRIVAEDQPLPEPAGDLLPPAWDYPGLFRKAAADHLSRLPADLVASVVPGDKMREFVAIVRDQMDPRVALRNLARAAVTTGDNVLPPTAPGVTPIGTETIMMTPSFPQPMYEPLKEQSQELVLPGLDTVPPDTVLGLKTNQAFVEAYMIGANVEMARELLWRGFPTDQQGTYFINFWASDAATGAAGDIGDLGRNLARMLGEPPPDAPANQFVLLLRSSLLRRYPNALIYLTPAGVGTPNTVPTDIHPIFNGSLEPDVSFVGFPITPAAAAGSGGDAGYYVVIQQHPTEPRFGLDDGAAAALENPSHLSIGSQQPDVVPPKEGCSWGKNSAHMAEIIRRRPVRILIHASQLVGPN